MCIHIVEGERQRQPTTDNRSATGLIIQLCKTVCFPFLCKSHKNCSVFVATAVCVHGSLRRRWGVSLRSMVTPAGRLGECPKYKEGAKAQLLLVECSHIIDLQAAKVVREKT